MLLIRTKAITRRQAAQALGIKSRALTNYCNELGLPSGTHWFTEDEFARLKRYRLWLERGGRKKDYQGDLTPVPRLPNMPNVG